MKLKQHLNPDKLGQLVLIKNAQHVSYKILYKRGKEFFKENKKNIVSCFEKFFSYRNIKYWNEIRKDLLKILVIRKNFEKYVD